jgi:hypothetical protein
MKALLDFLSLPLSLPINPIWDFVICAIIGEIAYWVAYSFAGRNASSSAGRSVLHWAVRIPLYFILWLIACIIITVVNFIKANWVWVLITLGILAVVGVLIIVILQIVHKKKQNKSSDSNSGD